MRFIHIVFFTFLLSSSSAQVSDTLIYVLGKFDPATHPDFVKVPSTLATKDDLYLRKEVMDAFRSMAEAANKDGVKLRILSATRNFNHQKRIWESKWNGERSVGGANLKQTMPDPSQRAREILKYSSMPGTSRHHWGTDIDINALNSSYFKTGKGREEFEWLRKNASKFGFCQVYSPKNEKRPNGYEEEEWHWSYLPSASKFTEFYAKNLGQKDISGFAGSDSLPFKEVLKYVLGISAECK